MKSLDTLLAEAVGKMKPSTLKKFNEQTRGESISQESLINIAESLVAEDGEDYDVRPLRIRRNNGAQRSDSQDAYSEESSEAVLLEGLAKARPETFGKLLEVKEDVGRLSVKQKEDFEFAKAVGLSERDALKVALSGDIRD